MATVVTSKKSCAVNPLKMSQPIGAALAFMGLDGCMPVLHGSQGCTAFGLVLFVRHFREAIPLQTTAMNEVTTIMGGMENVEQALLNIHKRTQPKVVCIASTGLTETKGDDVDGHIKLIRQRQPELADLPIVYVSTPDYKDAFQDGWAKAVQHLVRDLCEPLAPAEPRRVNILPGSHLSPGDLDELRDIVSDFGLDAVIVPDLSGSLDGHIPEDFSPTTIGGASLEQIRTLGGAGLTLAIGEQMRPAAETLHEKTGARWELFDRLTGLEANDRLLMLLSEVSGRPVPLKYRRQRSQLVDAMLDGHFFFGRKKIAIGAEPDLLWSLGKFLAEMGCDIAVAITTTHSPVLERMPCAEVVIGDLEDMEQRAEAAGCDLLMTHSHGRQMSERLGVPLVRVGLPLFDRLGAAHRCQVGYRGSRDLVFELGNIFIVNGHEIEAPEQEERDPMPAQTTDHAKATIAAG